MQPRRWVLRFCYLEATEGLYWPCLKPYSSNHKHTCLRLMAAICTKKRLKQNDLSILIKKTNPRNFVLGKFESDFLIFV
jgi:hypothetical protein